MKKFIKWKILILTCAVCLLPILLGIALWDALPESIAIHFDINNTPDNYASKGFTVFGLPFMMVALQIACCVINDVNAKKYGDRKKLELVTKWIIPIMSIVLQTITFLYALKVDIDIRRWAISICGIIFIAVGNYLPKLDYIKNFKNNVDKEKSRKINRFIGFKSVIMGILALVTLVLPPITSLIWIFMLIPYAIISIIYTIIVIRR